MSRQHSMGPRTQLVKLTSSEVVRMVLTCNSSQPRVWEQRMHVWENTLITATYKTSRQLIIGERYKRAIRLIKPWVKDYTQTLTIIYQQTAPKQTLKLLYNGDIIFQAKTIPRVNPWETDKGGGGGGGVLKNSKTRAFYKETFLHKR